MKKEEISIAIVDDNPAVNRQIKEKLNVVFKLKTFENVQFSEVDFYEDGKCFLASEKAYDLILMDYEMPRINGIQVAIELDKRGTESRILFLSGYSEIIEPLQKATAIKRTAGFIFKSASIKEFQHEVVRVIKDILDVYFITVRYYEEEWDVDCNKFKKIFYERVIDARKIVTIEAQKGIVFVYTENEEFSTNISLKEWLLKVPKSHFSYANKSCLVNLKYVHSHSGQKINLIAGDTVKLGRYSKNEFVKNYKNYMMKEAMM